MCVSIITKTSATGDNNEVFDTWTLKGFGKTYRLMFFRSSENKDLIGLSRIEVESKGGWSILARELEFQQDSLSESQQDFYNKCIEFIARKNQREIHT